MNDTAARKVAIRNLFRAYPSSVNTDMATIDIYVAATNGFSLEAISRSVEQFATGKVERDNRAFAPSADEFSANAQLWQKLWEKMNAKEIPLYTGNLNVDFGGGNVDVRGLTKIEQDLVWDAKGVTKDGRQMSHMSLDEIRQSVNGEKIEGPKFTAAKLGRI